MQLSIPITYAGRTERSSPAVGATYKHKAEQSELLEAAFHLKSEMSNRILKSK